MTQALKVRPLGALYGATEPHDVSRDQVYRRWVETAQLYGAALQRAPFARTKGPAIASGNIRTLAVHLDRADQAGVDGVLQSAYYGMRPGDILVLDAPQPVGAPQDRGMQRDVVSRALFWAGFERPMIWAGRKLLDAENRASWVNRMLPARALGAGPPRIPGVAASLEPGAQQLIAIARRGALAPPRERLLRLSVVMPVYNEKKTFVEAIEALLAKSIPGYEIEICLVESNSTDGTRADVLRYAEHPRVKLLLEDRPSGKGHAVRKGLELASGDIIIIQDADLEYDLADYEKLLDPIAGLKTSFVLGSRHPAGDSGWKIRHFSEQRIVSDMMNAGHLFFTWFLNTIYRQRARDPFTMYKVFRRDCINNIRFECNRFDFDLELFGKLIRNGFRPIEIDVRYNSRSFDEGKKVSLLGDPPRWIKAGLLHRFSNLHIWPQHH